MRISSRHGESDVIVTIICVILISLVKQTHAKPWNEDTEAATPAAIATTSTTISETNPNESQNQHQNQMAQKAMTPSYQFDMQVEPFMQVHKLSATSNNITCNDGSQVGYYQRLNKHSKSWIIYLQGGGFCGSEESCQQRWQRSAHLMSSNYWPKTKTVEGILSNEPKENPYLWNANHIYVPYCSSDSWTGLLQARDKSIGSNGASSSFSFMGSKIIERVLDSLYDDLPRESSLHEAKFILLAGDSAGATGVIMNLDKVNGIVQQRAAAASSPSTNCASIGDQSICEPKQAPVLRGLADSGWFLDNEPYGFGDGDPYLNEQEGAGANSNEDCNRQGCTPLQSIKQAKLLWNGQVPPACGVRYPLEPWRCYFGYRAYQSLQTPLFVVQWLYDEAQLMVDNIARPDTAGQWNYVNKVVNEMRTSLENVTALFAPSCFSHSLIIRRSWNQININGFKLPHVLNSWEEQSLLGTNPPAIEPKPMKNENDSLRLMADQQPAQDNLGHQVGMAQIVNSSSPSIINQPTFETVLVDHDGPLSQLSGSIPIMPPQPPQSQINHQSKEFDLRINSQVSHDPRQNHSVLKNPPSTGSSSNANNNNRSRMRKRRRNNQHQQQRTKQARQNKPAPITSETIQASPMSETPLATYPFSSKDSNDLSSSAANPLQDLLPLIDRSWASGDLLYGRLGRDTSGAASYSNGRLGRSTVVDESTLMLSNNVPDDNYAGHPIAQQNQDHRLNSKWSWSRDSRSHPAIIVGNGFMSTSKQMGADRFRLIDSCGWPQCNRDCPVLDSDLNAGGLI